MFATSSYCPPTTVSTPTTEPFASRTEALQEVRGYMWFIGAIAVLYLLSPFAAWALGFEQIPNLIYYLWVMGALLVLFVGLGPATTAVDSLDRARIDHYQFVAQLVAAGSLLVLSGLWAATLIMLMIA